MPKEFYCSGVVYITFSGLIVIFRGMDLACLCFLGFPNAIRLSPLYKIQQLLLMRKIPNYGHVSTYYLGAHNKRKQDKGGASYELCMHCNYRQQLMMKFEILKWVGASIGGNTPKSPELKFKLINPCWPCDRYDHNNQLASYQLCHTGILNADCYQRKLSGPRPTIISEALWQPDDHFIQAYFLAPLHFQYLSLQSSMPTMTSYPQMVNHNNIISVFLPALYEP